MEVKILLVCFVVLSLVSAVNGVELGVSIGDYDRNVVKDAMVTVPVTIMISGIQSGEYSVFVSVIPEPGLSCSTCASTLIFTSNGSKSTSFILNAEIAGTYDAPFTIVAVTRRVIVSSETASSSIVVTEPVVVDTPKLHNTSASVMLLSTNTLVQGALSQGTEWEIIEDDEYYMSLIEVTLGLSGLKLDSIEIVDGRDKGGVKTVVIAHTSQASILGGITSKVKVAGLDIAEEMGKVFGVFLEAKIAGMDVDELNVVAVDERSMPIGVYYCKKEWVDAYIVGDITIEDISLRVLGTFTTPGVYPERGRIELAQVRPIMV